VYRTLRVTLVTCLTVLYLFLPLQRAECWRCQTMVGGSGYFEAKSCPSLAPAVLFAAVTLGAILAIVLKTEKDDGHSHTHVHVHGT